MGTILIVFTLFAGIFIILSFRTKNLKKRFVFIIPAIGVTYVLTFIDIIRGNNYQIEFISFIFFAIAGFKRLLDMYSNNNDPTS